MNVTLEFRSALYSMVLDPGKLLSPARVLVKSEDCAIYESFPATRDGYKQAERFVRLLERGYSPFKAYCAAKLPPLNVENFSACMDVSAHDKLTDEIVDALPIDCPDMMFTDPLTPADQERLYAMWLQDGDEIFHFDPELSALWDIPGMLSYFRALTQAEDERTGNFTHSHHLDPISY